MSFPPLNWIEDASASTFQDNVRVSLASRKRAFCRGLIFSIFLGAACGLFIWKFADRQEDLGSRTVIQRTFLPQGIGNVLRDQGLLAAATCPCRNKSIPHEQFVKFPYTDEQILATCSQFAPADSGDQKLTTSTTSQIQQEQFQQQFVQQTRQIMCRNLLGKAAQRLIANNFVSETALTSRQVDRTVRILAVETALDVAGSVLLNQILMSSAQNQTLNVNSFGAPSGNNSQTISGLYATSGLLVRLANDTNQSLTNLTDAVNNATIINYNGYLSICNPSYCDVVARKGDLSFAVQVLSTFGGLLGTAITIGAFAWHAFRWVAEHMHRCFGAADGDNDWRSMDLPNCHRCIDRYACPNDTCNMPLAHLK